MLDEVGDSNPQRACESMCWNPKVIPHSQKKFGFRAIRTTSKRKEVTLSILVNRLMRSIDLKDVKPFLMDLQYSAYSRSDAVRRC